MSALTPAELRGIDLFDDLDDAALAEWAAAADVTTVPAGDVIAEQEEHVNGLQLLLEGTAQAFVAQDGRVEAVSEHVAPTWMGAIASLTGDTLAVRIVAVTEVRLALVPTEAFIDLTMAHRSVFRRAMAQVRPVLGRIQAMEQNRERLAALGTMAAGLAHELNNPAAAARRSAGKLADALEAISTAVGAFVDAGIERAQAGELVAIQQAALAAAAARGPADALDDADAEDDLLEALEDAGVEEAWRYAEALVAAGADRAWLAHVAGLAGPAVGEAVRWIAASVAARQLAAELAESTDRMSALVAAVKSYAYMDRGGVVEADVHEGLETTLTILGHKLKHTSIEVVRHYDTTLPKLTVRGSELNQVWTNLLDNAIAALGDAGTITLTTRRDGPCVVVDVADDGPGIPPELLDRIFEPFFTTKDVGQGTGLGLDTARRIVVDRHGGSLTVESAPGRTVFHVWLPTDGALTPPSKKEAP